MNSALIATLLSLAVTVLTSLFKTVDLSSKQKNLIATGLSILAGTATVLTGGATLSVGSIASTAVAIYGASQIAYQFILKGTSLDSRLLASSVFGTGTKSQVEAVLDIVEAVEQVATPKPKRATRKKAEEVAPKTTKKRTKNTDATV